MTKTTQKSARVYVGSVYVYIVCVCVCMCQGDYGMLGVSGV